jgi:stress response protein SCP2
MAQTTTIQNTDTDGTAVTTQAFQIDNPSHTSVQSWVAIIENGFGVDVDVTVQFTTDDDPDFQKYITDSQLENVTITADTRTGFGDEDNEAFSYIRFEITPASDPTSGTVDVTFQSRQLGGSN